MTRLKTIATTIKKRKMNFKLKDMRKRIFMTAVAVFIGTANFAQTTMASASLTTQSQVDAFSTTVTEITGFLNIGGTDISNLDGLARLEIVGGLLNILSNPALASLGGLGALTSVGGNLVIDNNDSLTSLEGLNGIESSNNLSIIGNEKLLNLSGLNNFVRANFSVGINFNPALTSLESLDMLTSITLNLSIHSNAMLSTLNGLENLTSLGGRILIGTSNESNSRPNPALTNFCAISQLVLGNTPQITTSEYFIKNNAYNPTYAQLGNMETCEGITQNGDLTLTTQEEIDMVAGNIIAITGNVKIKETMAGTITSLNNLANIASITGNLEILDNSMLETLEGLGNLATLGGELRIGTIDGEDTSLNPNAALINFCAISQLVTGTPQITTTEYFVANNRYNPNYAQLGNMATCERIARDSDLMITTQEEVNMAVNIIAVTGNVKIEEATTGTITSLNGLANVTSITGNLEILNNSMLETLEGLGNLATLGGELQIGTTDGSTMNPNAALIDFCAISDLVSGDTPQIIKAEDNTNEYFVANNGYNPNYSQLGNMTTCEGITQNGNLMITTEEEIMTAGNIIAITGDLKIKETMAGTITSLNGLVNIASITGNLQILNNTALTSLEGLGNLATLGGKLQIGTTDGTSGSSMPNMALIDFCAISQLVTGVSQITTTEYFVANNSYNPTLVGLGNNRAETSVGARDGCAKLGTVVVSTNTFSKEEDYRLFPNPVSDVLFVKSESKITSITISNVSGQEVLKSNSASINVQNLSKGIYFARIVSGEKTIVEKFVKL